MPLQHIARFDPGSPPSSDEKKGMLLIKPSSAIPLNLVNPPVTNFTRGLSTRLIFVAIISTISPGHAGDKGAQKHRESRKNRGP